MKISPLFSHYCEFLFSQRLLLRLGFLIKFPVKRKKIDFKFPHLRSLIYFFTCIASLSYHTSYKQPNFTKKQKRHIFNKTVIEQIFKHLCCFKTSKNLKQLIVTKTSTICPRSSYPFYIVRYYIKWVTTSGTYGRHTVHCTVLRWNLLQE